MSIRHFLNLRDISKPDLLGILASARKMKTVRKGLPRGTPDADKPLAGRVAALVFEQPSTRTRVSFDIAMRQLGGESLTLNKAELQLGRGETIGDTARVLSRYVDLIMVRTDREMKLLEMAAGASVPVINGLTERGHPCQIMADVMTLEENTGSIAGKTVAWIGDYNNVCMSWIEAAERLGFTLRIAGPHNFQPPEVELAFARKAGARIEVVEDPVAAVKDADCVTTDAWASMTHTDRHERIAAFQSFQVNAALMQHARKDAIFLHCLPAHRGEEVTDEVLDGPQSRALDEAENRLHVQKAILRWCLEL